MDERMDGWVCIWIDERMGDQKEVGEKSWGKSVFIGFIEADKFEHEENLQRLKSTYNKMRFASNKYPNPIAH